jgi:hypothetical protein
MSNPNPQYAITGRAKVKYKSGTSLINDGAGLNVNGGSGGLS